MKMKLLDLQTGKYLELGKDFYYGVWNIFLTNLCDGMFFIDMIEKKDFIQAKPHTDPIINRLAEKVGAVVYGGRYVLLRQQVNGDVFCEKTNFGTVYYMSKDIYKFIPPKDFNQNNDIVGTVSRFFMLNKAPQYKIGNIFEEYSKQLRSQPNKFEEFYNLIYGKK